MREISCGSRSAAASTGTRLLCAFQAKEVSGQTKRPSESSVSFVVRILEAEPESDRNREEKNLGLLFCTVRTRWVA